MFEGEYLNGLRNGKGIYYTCDVRIECEFLNGRMNGKGKEYNNKGEIMFEGEYLNGRKWNGKGREETWVKTKQTKISYEYLNGKKFQK